MSGYPAPHHPGERCSVHEKCSLYCSCSCDEFQPSLSIQFYSIFPRIFQKNAFEQVSFFTPDMFTFPFPRKRESPCHLTVFGVRCWKTIRGWGDSRFRGEGGLARLRPATGRGFSTAAYPRISARCVIFFAAEFIHSVYSARNLPTHQLF